MLASYEHLQQKASEPLAIPPSTPNRTLDEFAADALGEARLSLFAATMYALAVKAAEADDLMDALNEQLDLTVKLHEAGLLPEGLNLRGAEPLAHTWLEKNIDRLVKSADTPPAVRQWARLHDERHRIRHLLPTLN